MMNQNFEDFLQDFFIQQSHYKNDLYSLFENNYFEINVKNYSSKSFQEITRLLFNFLLNKIENKTHIVHNQKCDQNCKISFHNRFGWTVSSRLGISYLGKISMPYNPFIELGINSYCSGACSILGSNILKIGSYCSIANNCIFYTSNISHPTQFASTYNLGGNRRIIAQGLNWDTNFYDLTNVKNDIEISNDVYIGADVTIMPGTKINNGVVIALGAVVTGECESYGIYGGVPARLIKYRFPNEIIEQLIELEWWNWNLDKIQKNQEFFLTDLIKYTGSLSRLII